ncbi:MAG: porin [Hyphomicrobiaceae bacterium]|nr:porin [Hyphomicrobiaceae bacterium]
MSIARNTTLLASIAIALAVVVAFQPQRAAAADLGGDCCADLEARIAELEETSVRKGNRRVSLEISGQVSQGLLVWDDGSETNVYQVSNSSSSDRLRFDGRSRLSDDLISGMYLEFSFGLPSSAGIDQDTDDGNGSLRLRQSLWYLRSRSLGGISVGLAAPATDDLIGYNFGRTTLGGSADTSLVGTNLITRDSTIAGPDGLNSRSAGNTISLRWRRFLPQLDTPIGNLVRYDSPVLHGFTASASWGEDDRWDAAVRFARDFGDVRFAIGAGYLEDREEATFTFGWPRGGDSDPSGVSGNTIVRDWKGSLSLMHEPTGLFASGAYLHRDYSGSDLGTLTFACFGSGDAADIRAAGVACGNRPDFDYLWASAGVRRHVFPLGRTTVYGEYARSEDAIGGLNVSVRSADGGDIDYVTSSVMEIWGGGVVQEIGRTGIDLFLSYRHFTADVVGLEADGTRFNAPLEDADTVFAGSRIRF